MNRGVNRQRIFFADEDRIEFGRLLGESHARFGVETLAYCLVPNHYHLLLRCPSGGLSTAMQHISSVYTRHTNDRVGRDGPLFRGRFHSIVVDDDVYAKWAFRYIHLNALDVRDVRRPEDYRWSSYRAYLGHRTPPPFMNTSVMSDLFDGDTDRIRSFTTGNERPIPRHLRAFVQSAIAIDDIAHGFDAGTHAQRLERTILTLLVEVSPAPDIRRAAEASLGPLAGAARRMALCRARQRLRDDPAVRRIVDSLLAELRLPRLAA
jgi:REP element-mobilizing transposase RayT